MGKKAFLIKIVVTTLPIVGTLHATSPPWKTIKTNSYSEEKFKSFCEDYIAEPILDEDKDEDKDEDEDELDILDTIILW